jgi:long-chain fatty acid transport protein
VFSSSPSRASMFDTFGYSARAVGMGNAMTALGGDYDAVYYNPANVLLRGRAHVGLGLHLVAPSFTFETLEGDARSRLPETQTGFHIGGVTPLGGFLNRQIGLGIAFSHPLSTGTEVASIDPAKPYFYRYQGLPDKLIVALALAVEPVEWLRIGLGAQILAGFGGTVEASLSLTEGRFTSERIDVSISPTASPTAGFSVGPFDGIRFGATYRHRLALDYALPVRVDIEEIGRLDVTVKGVSLFQPSQLALGLSWESAPAPSPGISTELGVTWEMWDDAPPAGADFELTIDDSLVRPGDAQTVLKAFGPTTPLGARDTLTPRVGIEWRPSGTWAVRGGYFFRPTPLPRPVYQTNTLDASAHVFSLGGGVTLGDPTGITATPVHIDLGAQLTWLQRRFVQKLPDGEGGEPPGAYFFEGPVWHVVLDIRYDYQ